MSHVFRQLGTVISFAAQEIAKNPRHFSHLVYERLRIALAGTVSPLSDKGTPPHPDQDGKPNSTEASSSSVSWMNEGNSTFSRKMTSQQHQDCRATSSVEDQTNRATIRAVGLFTSSFPYTLSGYTVRTHKFLQSIHNEQVDFTPVTRLGYPATIGKITKFPSVQVDDIVYRSQIPHIYPLTDRKRIKKASTNIQRLAKADSADLLFTTTDHSNGAPIQHAARSLDIPWVYEIRGERENTWLAQFPTEEQEERKSDPFYRHFVEKELAVARDADAIITLSQLSAETWVERGIPRDRIFVVPNAVSSNLVGLNVEKKAVRRDLGLPADVHLFGTVTSLVHYEGIDTAIRALSQLPSNYHLLIVGDGVARRFLESTANKYHVIERTHFVGKVPEAVAWKYYGAMDTFVVPRKDVEVCRRVTPLKAVTAQAMGIPLVMSDLPALREVSGGHAVFVSPDDEHSLAQGIVQAEMLSPDEGITWAASRTWERNAAKYRRVFESVLRK